jgi:hypothetical protein
MVGISIDVDWRVTRLPLHVSPIVKYFTLARVGFGVLAISMDRHDAEFLLL